VTSRSKSGNGSDSTWRELTTVLIVDNVVSGLRESLKARFHRARNTEQTRGAIRSQVILELENKKNREMIAGYQAVSVQAMEENPTVCLVTFAFSVSHGLNQIWISAHISV
jgi:Phage tail sheath protein.